MAKGPTISTITAAFASASKLNANFTAIDTAFDNTVSRDGSTPNTMTADFDMNSNNIVNVSSLDVDTFILGGTAVTAGVLPAATVDIHAFDTRVIVAATNVDAGSNFIRTAGYTSIGDDGGALYKRVGAEPSHDFKVQSADGAWWEGLVDNGRINPRAIGGTSDEASAQKAFDYAVDEGPEEWVVVFSGDWTIASTVTISDPQDISVDAKGAFFTTPNDILMFDLNGRADPTYADNESRQNFNWVGGRFHCTFSTPLKATAFRMLGFRHATLRPEIFSGWFRDIITGGKDTLYIGEYKTNLATTSIEIPPWSHIGASLMYVFEKIHVAPGANHGRFLNSYFGLNDSVIRDISVNMNSNTDVQGAIDIHSDILFGLSAQSGTFSDGETVTGGTSGATCVFRELYTHDFAFDITQHLKWLVGEDRSVTVFQTGEALTAPSGATGTIGANAGYLMQDQGWQDFRIEGAIHFESGSGANGAIGIRLRDRINRGVGDVQIYVDVGTININDSGSIGLELQNLAKVQIQGRFNQGSASSSIPIKLNSGCSEITILKPTQFGTGAIDLNGMSREQLDMSDHNVTLGQNAPLTGWVPKALTTTGVTLLDMSADFPKFATVGGLAPIAYDISALAHDSGSAATAGTRFRMHHPDDTPFESFQNLAIGGVPDDQSRGAQYTVGADSNGDIEYDAVASGSGTLDVTLNVRRMLY